MQIIFIVNKYTVLILFATNIKISYYLFGVEPK